MVSASLVDDNIYIFKSKHKNFEVYNFAGEKIEQSSWKNAFPYIAHYDIHNARFSIVEFQFKNGKNRVEYKQLDNDQKTIKKIKLDENMDEINSDFIGWHNDLLYYYNLKQGELTLISPLGDHSVINVQEFGFTPASI